MAFAEIFLLVESPGGAVRFRSREGPRRAAGTDAVKAAVRSGRHGVSGPGVAWGCARWDTCEAENFMG